MDGQLVRLRNLCGSVGEMSGKDGGDHDWPSWRDRCLSWRNGQSSCSDTLMAKLVRRVAKLARWVVQLVNGQVGEMSGQDGEMSGQVGKMSGQDGKMSGQIGEMGC
jgi:hypothetical protein